MWFLLELRDFGINYVAETDCVIISKSRYARGRTPIEIVTGVTPDISEYLDFGFWDLVLYKSKAGVGAPELGMWLGVSHSIGPGCLIGYYQRQVYPYLVQLCKG